MIRLEQVTKYYRSSELITVGIRRISLDFKIGEFVAITGESGSGKSTLLNILSGLDTFEEGEFYLFGNPTSHYGIAEWESYRAQYVGFVFQNYNIVDAYTVYQNVLLALEFQGYDSDTRHQRAVELIDKVGLSHRIHHKASKLSGGEKQRTVIARALAKDCPAIFCDEPTGNLDSKTSEDILKLLHEISKDKLVIIVTHNYEEVEPYVDRRIKMSDGEIVEDIEYRDRSDLKDEPIEEKEKLVSFKTGLGIAYRNMLSTPRRFIFFLTLQAIFVFLVFLIYGSILSLGYQSQINPDAIEASPHQIIIQKTDETPFSASEITYFENMRYVRAVTPDETIHSLIRNIDRKAVFSDRTQVLRSSDIKEGRFPEDATEIMISQDLVIHLDVSLGDEVTLTAFNGDTYDFFVVGISEKVSSSIYLHDDFYSDQENIFRSLAQMVSISNSDDTLINPLTSDYRSIYKDESLSGYDAKAEVSYNLTGTRISTMVMETGYGTRYQEVLNSSFTFVESGKKLYVSPMLYDVLVNHFTRPELRYKIVLNVADEFDATRVIEEIDQEAYIIYYPPMTLNTGSSNFTLILRIASYVSIIMVALFMFSLLRFVFKQMVQTRRKDFAIFRSVGANQAFLRTMIIMEQVIQIVLGTALTVVTVFILTIFSEQVSGIMKFVTWTDMLFVFVIFSYMTIRTPLRFNQLIFEISVIDTLRSSTEVTS